MTAEVELSVVLCRLNTDLGDPWEAIAYHFENLEKMQLFFALLGYQHYQHTAVMPNPVENGKQLCPIISKIIAFEASATVPKAMVRDMIYNSPDLPEH